MKQQPKSPELQKMFEILQDKFLHTQKLNQIQSSEINVLRQEKQQLEAHLRELQEKFLNCSRIQSELEEKQKNSQKVAQEKLELIQKIQLLKKQCKDEKEKYRQRYEKLKDKAQVKIHRLKDCVTEYQVHITSLMKEVDRLKNIIISSQDERHKFLNYKNHQYEVMRKKFDDELKLIEFDVNDQLNQILTQNNLPIESIHLTKKKEQSSKIGAKLHLLLEGVRMLHCEQQLLQHLVRENYKLIQEEIIKFSDSPMLKQGKQLEMTQNKKQFNIPATTQTLNSLHYQISKLMSDFRQKMASLSARIQEQFQVSCNNTSEKIFTSEESLKTESKYANLRDYTKMIQPISKLKTEKTISLSLFPEEQKILQMATFVYRPELIESSQEFQIMIRKNLMSEFEKATSQKETVTNQEKQ